VPKSQRKITPTLQTITHGEKTSPKLLRKKCIDCNTIMILSKQQTRKLCRMCINERTSIAGKNSWAVRLWTTEKIRDMLPDIEDNT